MENRDLDSLILSKDIASYCYEGIEDSPGSEMRNMEKLEINFPSGTKLILGTFCSGSLQNTSLLFKLDNKSKKAK